MHSVFLNDSIWDSSKHLSQNCNENTSVEPERCKTLVPHWLSQLQLGYALQTICTTTTCRTPIRSTCFAVFKISINPCRLPEKDQAWEWRWVEKEALDIFGPNLICILRRISRPQIPEGPHQWCSNQQHVVRLTITPEPIILFPSQHGREKQIWVIASIQVFSRFKFVWRWLLHHEVI